MLNNTIYPDGGICQDLPWVMARIERFRLKLIAASFLPANKRVRYCCRRAISGQTGMKGMNQQTGSGCSVKIMINEKINRASFAGLMTCGSVWDCPVCCGKTSERRKIEVKTALDKWHSEGCYVSMMTVTIPHYVHQALKQVLSNLKKSLRKFKFNEPYRHFIETYGVIGLIHALEATYGYENGWHPHYHLPIFHQYPILDYKAAEILLLKSWQSVAAALKLPSPNGHGLSLQDGSAVHAYITKYGVNSGVWGIEHEVTKGHSKKGRDGHYTPFDLLRLGEKELFREYSKAFFGTPQLRWQNGLKARFGINEMTDEEIAAQTEEGFKTLANLTTEQWVIIDSHYAQAEIMRAAEIGRWPAVIAVIEKLTKKGKS